LSGFAGCALHVTPSLHGGMTSIGVIWHLVVNAPCDKTRQASDRKLMDDKEGIVVATVTNQFKDKIACPKLPSGDFVVGAFGDDIGVLRKGLYGWYWLERPLDMFNSRPDAIDSYVGTLISQGVLRADPEFSISRREHVSGAVKAFVRERDMGRCQHCNVEIMGVTEVFDHFIPVAFGGASTVENLLLSCKDCNREKWHIPPWRLYGENWKDYEPGKPRPGED